VQQTLPIDPADAGPAVRGAVPEPYEAFRVGDARVVALPRAADRVREAVASAGSLFAYAESHPGREALPGGRGPIYRIPGLKVDWVVRRYRRGGWMRWLGERHLRLGAARPFAELRVSVAVRSRGVPTPEVLAGAVYPAGLFYRADLVTAYIPDSYDLATLLFGPQPLEGDERKVAWAEAGRLLRWLYSLGVIHTDLNLGNILLERCARPPRPYLLDLDRCRVVRDVTPRQRRRMRKRFRRSAEKWSHATGRPISREEWHALQAAYRTKRV
jgi:3-deoxy-D-manno-octulosonic acid kinase